MAKDLLNEVANMVETNDQKFVSKEVNCVISDFIQDAEMLE
mgnify:CR=1 FL=1